MRFVHLIKTARRSCREKVLLYARGNARFEKFILCMGIGAGSDDTVAISDYGVKVGEGEYREGAAPKSDKLRHMWSRSQLLE